MHSICMQECVSLQESGLWLFGSLAHALVFLFCPCRSVWTEVCPGMRPTTGHWSSTAPTRDSTCPRRWVPLIHTSQNNNVMSQWMLAESVFSSNKNSLSMPPLHSCEETTHVCCWLSKEEARTSLSSSLISESRATPRAWTTYTNVTGR